MRSEIGDAAFFVERDFAPDVYAAMYLYASLGQVS